jgi:tetratricopeptide (TPR) repeat protein
MALALPPRAASAQEAARPAAPSPKMAEAQQRYRRGIELVNEGAYESALLEFRRAYELAPSYRILFNIGQVSRALNDYAGALRSFERYLKDGGADVPAEQVAEIRKELEVLRTRVARLSVTSTVAGAEVSVDDLVVGRTPLAEPVTVNAGRRKVTVAAAGRLPETRVIEAAGADSVTLAFDLTAPREQAPAAGGASAAPRAASRGALPWVLWGGAGALAAGAVVTGLVALKASGDFDDLKGAPVSQARNKAYDDTYARLTRFGLATDVLAGLALVTGGAALYVTLKSPGGGGDSARAAPALAGGVGPGGLTLRGAF